MFGIGGKLPSLRRRKGQDPLNVGDRGIRFSGLMENHFLRTVGPSSFLLEHLSKKKSQYVYV